MSPRQSVEPPCCECTRCGLRLDSHPSSVEDRIDHAIEAHGVEDLDEYREIYRSVSGRRVPE